MELMESVSLGERTPSDGNSNDSASETRSEGGDSAAASSWDSLLGSPGQNMINKSKRRNSKSPSRARMLIERLTSTNSSGDSISEEGSEDRVVANRSRDLSDLEDKTDHNTTTATDSNNVQTSNGTDVGETRVVEEVEVENGADISDGDNAASDTEAKENDNSEEP